MSESTAPVILHVLESYGAGSARAAESYAAALPEFRHVVLRHLRQGESTAGQEHAAFAAVYDLPSSPGAAIRAVRKVVRSTRPSRIHAHSSFAGAWVRLALPGRIARRRVVYTPHCFAFEREDLPSLARRIIRGAERALAPRTAVIAACSVREAELASGYRTLRPPVLVPNSARNAPTGAPPRRMLIGIGRLGRQKDPELFARIAHAAHRADGTTSLWIGDGDARPMMERFGVDVSGWRSASEVAALCAEGGVYVHTARWEGFPLAVLEAHRTGLPIIARRIGAMAGMPDEWLFDDVDEALELLQRISTAAGREEALAAWGAALLSNTHSAQREALLQAYDLRVPIAS